MAEKVIYQCEKCGKQVQHAGAPADLPECCEKVMTAAELDQCQTTATPEHSRPDGGDPCDDGRAGS